MGKKRIKFFAGQFDFELLRRGGEAEMIGDRFMKANKQVNE